ncbi:MAG: DUF4190 domain-containing protein [Phycisphaerales bacterium]|nr:DUF4190 domain-containing protein [Phycisphaerales bacterium]
MPASADNPGPGTEVRSRTPALAITALVLALVPCCPLTGLVGAMLGFTAYRRAVREEAAGGQDRGRRLALAAMVIGGMGAVISTLTWNHLLLVTDEAQESMMTHQIRRIVAPEPDDDTALAEVWEDDAATPPEAERDAFADAVAARFGALDRITIVSTARTGSFFDPAIEAACVFHCERASPTGAVRFRVHARLGEPLDFRIVKLTIDGGERGDLILGGTPQAAGTP